MSDEYVPPPVPEGANTEGRNLWTSVTGEFEPAEQDLILLRMILDELVLIEKMGRELGEIASFVVPGSKNQEVAHPLVAELRQHRLAVASLLARLKFPEEETEEETEAKATAKSERARESVRARWQTPRKLQALK